jgi:ABC-type transporter Mla MlaB component
MRGNEDQWLGTPEGSPAMQANGPRPPPEPGTTVFLLEGPIDTAAIPALCGRVRALLESCDADPVVCDVGALIDPDAVTVDALARLQLTARRAGRQIRLRHACGELRELVVLMGLSDVLPCGMGSGLEQRGEAEEWE